MPSNSVRRSDLGVLHPVVRSAVERVLTELDAENLPFRVFESYRTPERQRILFAQGRTAPGDIVTKARPWSSYHQYGLAADFVLFIDDAWSWSTKGEHKRYWERLHEIGRAHGLEPLSWELPHLQYANTTIEKLRSGIYPPFGDDDWADNLQSAIAGWSGDEAAPPSPPQISRPGLQTTSLTDGEEGEGFGRLTDPVSEVIDEQPELGLTEAVIRAAQGSERIWGVPASVTLAQFILESARGTRMPRNSNNPFGIKARAGEPFVLASTKEVLNGRTVTVQAKFRKFASFDEAFSHHGKLLGTSRYYRKAMACRNDPTAFCHALTGIYATDPGYGGKLVKLIQTYDLTDYDRQGEGTAIVEATPVGESTTNPRAATMTLRFGDEGENVRALQSALKAVGYSVGEVDGKYGSLTRAAVAAFQADNRLAVSGEAIAETIAALNKAPPRPLARKRLEATEQDLRKDGSVIVTQAQRTKQLGWFASLLGALGIGNSALVTTAGNTAGAPDSVLPVVDLLSRVETVLGTAAGRADANQLNQLAQSAGDLLRGLKAGASPELAHLAVQLKALLPGDIAERYPDLERILTLLTSSNSLGSGAPKTIIDFLPGVDAGGVISAIASSFVPGFGGSAVALGVGLLAHYFGQKTSTARVQEHRDGSNLSH
ncbi:flagellum-specific peptidoglycan hydrolase FlgJ [Rhizobium sp. PP-F2F-G36]|nr:flagellum-specific peptidoglycan hydrolase FlgJ [Rhizobium sp. PP-F2F-G36]